jgi:hypothetical protein
MQEIIASFKGRRKGKAYPDYLNLRHLAVLVADGKALPRNQQYEYDRRGIQWIKLIN